MELLDYSLVTLVLLFAVGMTAGFLDTLVGGGGLITIPALMMAGAPPLYALGTNKLQSSMGSGTAALMMIIRKQVSLARIWPMMAAAFVGSLAGSVLVQFIDASVLEILIPVVIVSIAVYFIAAPTSHKKREAILSREKFSRTAVPTIGFYDGMFGPGTGSFFVLAAVSLRGKEIVSATALAKCLNFSTNLAAMFVFIYYAKILWLLGVVMMAGQTIGANLGARTLLKINPALLRWLVIAMCLAMLLSWVIGSR